MRVITLLCLLLVTVTCKGQTGMLGKTADYIKAYNLLPSGIGVFEKEGMNDDSTTYLQLVAKNDSKTTFRYYINKQGTCHWFVIMQPTSALIGTIMSLNKEYVKIGDNEWVNKSNDLRIDLSFRKDSNIFTTGFSRIE